MTSAHPLADEGREKLRMAVPDAWAQHAIHEFGPCSHPSACRLFHSLKVPHPGGGRLNTSSLAD